MPRRFLLKNDLEIIGKPVSFFNLVMVILKKLAVSSSNASPVIIKVFDL